MTGAGGGTKEHQIPFSDDMIRAILRGEKTQTRRVIKPQPWQPKLEYHLMPPIFLESGEWGWSLDGEISGPFIRCPYGQPGDRLWVREAWASSRCYDDLKPSGIPHHGDVLYDPNIVHNWHKKRLSIFMPRWASRIDLEITGVRGERVQEISEEDLRAEGTKLLDGHTLRESYECLWNYLNLKRGYGWKENPWVWVIEFKRIKP